MGEFSMTFQAKTTGSDDIKAVLSAISTLVEEATFEASGEGISFRGMDPSHVALIDVSWPNAAFSTYTCDSEIKFGVRVDEVIKLVKRASKSDDVELGITQDEQLHLGIGENKQYKIKLIEGSAVDAPLPKIKFDTKITMSTSSLDKILGDIQVISEYLTIAVEGDRAEFSGKGDSGEGAVVASSAEVASDENSTGSYSLEYLLPVVRAVGGTSENITCEFSSAKPLRVGFTIANMGYIHFYLAPRVEI